MLSDYTALLVLETEYDYQRFGIDRNALAEILTVGPGGITTIDRRRMPDKNVMPIVDARLPEPEPEEGLLDSLFGAKKKRAPVSASVESKTDRRSDDAPARFEAAAACGTPTTIETSAGPLAEMCISVPSLVQHSNFGIVKSSARLARCWCYGIRTVQPSP